MFTYTWDFRQWRWQRISGSCYRAGVKNIQGKGGMVIASAVCTRLPEAKQGLRWRGEDLGRFESYRLTALGSYFGLGRLQRAWPLGICAFYGLPSL